MRGHVKSRANLAKITTIHTKKDEAMKTLKKIAGKLSRLIKKYPNVIIPFAVMGVLDFITLYILYLAPQRPVSIALAPPIRAFWGEQFLHYPMNILLLPKLYNYAHMVLLATVGIVTTGAAIGMIHEASFGVKPKVFGSFSDTTSSG